MNTDANNNDKLITRELSQAVSAFTPPAGLKDQIREQIRAEQPSPRRRATRLLRVLVPAAAAAALLIAASLWLFSSNGSSSAAYAEMLAAVENSRSAEWIHMVSDDGKEEGWASLRPYRVFRKSAQGSVEFDDAESHRSLRYDPGKNKVRIQDSMLDSDVKRFGSFLDYVMNMIEADRDRGAEFEKSRCVINGRQCIVYSVSAPDGKSCKKLTADPRSNRIVRFEIIEQDQQVAMDFDYPESGPEDIYALGVPRDAEVIDVRTRDEQSYKILANSRQAQRRFEDAHPTLRAIVCLGEADEAAGAVMVDTISVYYQAVYCRRIESWQGIENVRIASSLRPIDVKHLDRYTQTHTPSRVHMTRPFRGGVVYTFSPTGEVEKRTYPGAPSRLERLFWKTVPWEYGQSLPDLDGPNGLLQGTQRVQAARVVDGVVRTLPMRLTIYVNAQRDYIAERSEEWVGSLDEPWVPQDEHGGAELTIPEHLGQSTRTITTVLEYAQTPAGHWYPRKQLIEKHREGKVTKRVRLIHLDTTCTFPDGLFSPEQVESQLDRQIEPN